MGRSTNRQDFFEAARHRWSRPAYSDQELLDRLLAILSERMAVSLIIDEMDEMPSAQLPASVGSLMRAYQLVGYTPLRILGTSRRTGRCAPSP
jgi:hypothetical protein